MVQKGVFRHSVFGDITVSRTRRARRVSVSVRPPGNIRLTLPCLVPLEEGIAFVDSKSDWIRKTIARLEAGQPAEIISMPYYTRTHSLRLNPGGSGSIKIKVRDSYIDICYPLEMHYADSEVQKAIKKGIEEAWRAEAKLLLPERMRTISERLGLPFRSVSVRNTVSKWGSCSVRNDISLSLHLMRLPDHLIDYILIHELCHTVHKNHGPAFHALLDKHTSGRHRELRKELRKFHTRW